MKEKSKNDPPNKKHIPQVLKRYQRKTSDPQNHTQLNEYKFLSKLKHHNIMKFIDALTEKFEYKKYLCLTMEYMAPLHELLFLNNDCQLYIFKQICQGLNYLHQQNILHRDIKPNSIFILLTHSKFSYHSQLFINQILANKLASSLIIIKLQVIRLAFYIFIFNSINFFNNFVGQLLYHEKPRLFQVNFQQIIPWLVQFSNGQKVHKTNYNKSLRDTQLSTYIQGTRNFLTQLAISIRSYEQHYYMEDKIQISFFVSIKKPNLFDKIISADGQVKLGDFGISTYIRDLMTPQTCTKNQRAPELFFELKEYYQSIDIWTLGCTLIELFTGKMLFDERSEIEIMSQIAELLGSLNEANWNGVSSLPMYLEFLNDSQPKLSKVLSTLPEYLQPLVDNMLRMNPIERPTIQQVLKYLDQMDIKDCSCQLGRISQNAMNESGKTKFQQII